MWLCFWGSLEFKLQLAETGQPQPTLIMRWFALPLRRHTARKYDLVDAFLPGHVNARERAGRAPARVGQGV